MLGGLAGLVFGLAVAWCNMLLTKRSMQKQDASAIMGVNVAPGAMPLMIMPSLPYFWH